MVVIEQNGYYENGAWFAGISPTLIGKRIIRTAPCDCGPYMDYSYCQFGAISPSPNDWVVFTGLENGNLFIKRQHVSIFGEEPKALAAHWNDGNWIEYTGEP
jgi:hypothetical protein